MIHPGYGFLSENAEFARKVEEAGIIFIGPQPEVIDGLGDKIKARTLGELLSSPPSTPVLNSFFRSYLHQRPRRPRYARRHRDFRRGKCVRPGARLPCDHQSCCLSCSCPLHFEMILNLFLPFPQYGGGGRGMRVVREAEAFESAFKSATSEALAAFGNGTVFVERFLDKPKHIGPSSLLLCSVFFPLTRRTSHRGSTSR
jgi:pyruvate carboxylase